ncbi:MAG TPA: hypothetical protein VFW11_20055 [Cyclobacteriaceae bacterium]|nr:hypothetical protein [Cyclobacteriaceae bacterium]
MNIDKYETNNYIQSLNSYKALYLSPMVPTRNMGETKNFFIDVLKFEMVRNDEQYVILHKNNLTVHLLNAGKDIGEMEFYLEVDDVDAVWGLMKDEIKGLKVKEPFNQPYGMREIHIEVPATNTLLFIGQPIHP